MKFTLSPIEVRFGAQRSSFSYEEKDFHMQSVGSLTSFSDFLRNSKPKDQRLQVGLFY